MTQCYKLNYNCSKKRLNDLIHKGLEYEKEHNIRQPEKETIISYKDQQIAGLQAEIKDCIDIFEENKTLARLNEELQTRVKELENATDPYYLKTICNLEYKKSVLADKIKELEEKNKVGDFWHSAYQGKQLDYDLVYAELRKQLSENEKLKQQLKKYKENNNG